MELIGCRVEVNFGNQTLIGFVVGEKQTTDVPQNKLKEVGRLIDDKPVLSLLTLKLLRWAAGYYHHSLGEVLTAAVPKNIRRGDTFDREENVATFRLSQQAMGLPETALKRSKKQQEIFQYLLQHTSLQKDQIKNLGFSNQAIKALENKTLVTKTLEPLSNTAASRSLHENSILKAQPLALNTEQKQAFLSLDLTQYNCALLEGVTGSGKTEVYMQWAEKVLAQGKQVLVLIPEIGLCPQTITRFNARFNAPIAQLHSTVSEKKRGQYWQQAKNGTARIIIGTRLAALSDCENLGLIIVDEEHDLSYKQHDGFRYSARDIAVYRANLLNIPIALGSATPSLESLNNALAGRYKHLKVAQRVEAAAAPSIVIDDIRNQPLSAGLSRLSIAKIRETLEAGYQALVFLNRRGFAPSLYCNHCGWVATCLGCELAMTFHNRPRHLHCHRCDKHNGIPKHCPSCNNQQFSTKGLGTEQLETFLNDTFPLTSVVRIDRDTTQKKGSFEEIINTAREGQPCILVGTQMLAKGHHLPKVNLAIIVDIDQGLMSPDFRAIEHVGQLMVQVAGRAGRESKDGQVIIQTLQCDHPALTTLTQDGYHAFAKSLLDTRRLSHLPPFGYCALIRAEAKRGENALDFLNLVKAQVDTLRGQYQVQTIGPVNAPIEKLGHRFRFQYQLFSHSRKHLHGILKRVIAEVETNAIARRTRWSVDIDPVTTA